MPAENSMHPRIDPPRSEPAPGRLVMTLLVRNEEDIVRHTIDFHLSRGVDFIIATDNGSTDSTRDILKEYEERGALHLIDEDTHTHSQAEWNNRMARIAREKYGADYLFHCDADEFWHPRTGNLKDEISRRPEDILVVDVVNVLLSDRGGGECFPEDTRYAVVAPIVARDYQEETRENNLFYYQYPPKVMFKSGQRLFLVSQGNHAVVNKDGSTTEARSHDIVIYHYPLRSREQFSQKVILGGSAYEKNTVLDKSMGFHKRRWYESYKKGLLDKEYKKLIVDRGQAEKLLREGFLEELDFHELVNGAACRGSTAWRYYNRAFEYEALLQDFDKPWAGHKRFAYDLVRNLRPHTIVDLAAPGGTSFYSFCQGVRDARYDARLYAVDILNGDGMAGHKGRNGLREAAWITERCYPGLRIDLLRKTLSEALGHFEDGSIDVLHIGHTISCEMDGHDIERWLSKVGGQGIVLFHDLFANRDDFPVSRLWEELKRTYPTIEFHHSHGLGVLFKDPCRYRSLFENETQWRIRYSCIAEDMKNEQTRKAIAQVKAERDQALIGRDTAIAAADFMKRSLSWRVTRPLRYVIRIGRQGLQTKDSQLLSRELRRQYHRLPLPPAMKRLLSYAYHRVFRRALRSLVRTTGRLRRFHPPAVRPAARLRDRPDYIVWGIIDWHFRHQRPQQIALALAASGRRVFYVSSNLMDDERAGFLAESLDSSGRLFQIRLFAGQAPGIYSNAPGTDLVSRLRQSAGEVLDWADCREIVSLVEHPFWLDAASVLPNSRLVYDCMDHHQGFGTGAGSLLELEKRLLKEADLTVVTSAWLDEAMAPHARHRVLIRNAADYQHFSKTPPKVYRDPLGRRIIGYYGAIAEWFDLELVETAARRHPDCCILLVGADTINARSKLAGLANVTFTGEVPYSRLPHYLHGFDVCLLPFKVTELTLATNPVKVYEYLSAGKPVVAIDLPELRQFDGLVSLAAGRDVFLAELDRVLSTQEPASLVQRRKAFAREQTWHHRAELLIGHAESAARDPMVSVIVVTYNNLEFTRACLSSLDEHSLYERMEIIVIDNASSDGTPEFLTEWARGGSNRKVILNRENRGFPAANNQGLAVARGDYLVLLNNDTYVTPGWVRSLVGHLERDRSIGLIGPVTNNIGNEAKIDITYSSMEEMLAEATAYTRRHLGQTFEIRTAAFFCVMMPRATYERVGAMDESFGRGFFDDDDYCRRVEKAGLRVVFAEDVFIHHHLSASFDKLDHQDRHKLFEENRKIYEAKWGEWIPHVYRGRRPLERSEPHDIPDAFRE
jgi:GT2 family glycosyltransferase/glycosyltransferase involved in cell wall biosynthesis